MPDDARLRDLARAKGWRYRWRTWKEGEHWQAEVKAWKASGSWAGMAAAAGSRSNG